MQIQLTLTLAQRNAIADANTYIEQLEWQLENAKAKIGELTETNQRIDLLENAGEAILAALDYAALLKKPRWIFADEATSALDESAEQTIYGRLVAQVESAQGALLSIAHRPAVAGFHEQVWELVAQPDAADSGAGAAARYRLQARALA